jgi:hypothetical protein
LNLAVAALEVLAEGVLVVPAVLRVAAPEATQAILMPAAAAAVAALRW